MDTAAVQAPIIEDTAFVRFWNEVLAPKFIRFKHILVDGLSHHSEAVFPTLPVREGDHVLDVGCGFGDTALKLAARVGPTGSVVGIDCCDVFLDYARTEVRARNLKNVTFVRGDAEIALPTNQFDFVFARFGTMFFANPVAGLRNMRKRTASRVGAWCTSSGAERADNPWLSMAKDVVLRFLPPPGDEAQTCGPGPFSMSDERRRPRDDEERWLRTNRASAGRRAGPRRRGREGCHRLPTRDRAGRRGVSRSRCRSRTKARRDRSRAGGGHQPAKDRCRRDRHGQLVLGHQRDQPCIRRAT